MSQTEAVGGLVRYRTKWDDRNGVDLIVDDDYYARGVGWVNYGAAWSSWTAAEQRAVAEWRRKIGIGA